MKKIIANEKSVKQLRGGDSPNLSLAERDHETK